MNMYDMADMGIELDEMRAAMNEVIHDTRDEIEERKRRSSPADEFAQSVIGYGIEKQSWGFTFSLDLSDVGYIPRGLRSWYGADTYLGALERWLKVYDELVDLYESHGAA